MTRWEARTCSTSLPSAPETAGYFAADTRESKSSLMAPFASITWPSCDFSSVMDFSEPFSWLNVLSLWLFNSSSFDFKACLSRYSAINACRSSDSQACEVVKAFFRPLTSDDNFWFSMLASCRSFTRSWFFDCTSLSDLCTLTSSSETC